jgi:hypothetical protein
MPRRIDMRVDARRPMRLNYQRRATLSRVGAGAAISAGGTAKACREIVH